MFHYRFRILLEQNELDGRPFPAKSLCIAMLDDLLDIDSAEFGALLAGQWVDRDLSASAIVEFHQQRREAGCCSRIKWEHME